MTDDEGQDALMAALLGEELVLCRRGGPYKLRHLDLE
jgi:hypothetical protein